MSGPEVVVIGGGPAGTAAAYWLARGGRSVLLAEKKEYPREKTCGDGLTPRAIHQLAEMGFDFSVPELHRTEGLRSYAGDLCLELGWPDHGRYPSWGAVIRRADLDVQLANLAEKQGVTVRERTTAGLRLEGDRVAAVELERDGETDLVRPEAVVVADGSLSRIGRTLGTVRDRGYPLGLAARAYFRSPRSQDGVLESHLDIRDAEGATVPGYGWVFPLGDGTVNVGVGLLTTAARWRGANTSTLMDAFTASMPSYWEATSISEPRGGKLPMGFSVGPRVGPNWVVAGDAAGAINPFNGEGIAYAYETGRMAASWVDRSLSERDLALLAGYERELSETYGLYYRVGRLFVRAIGRPTVMRTLVRTGLRSRPLMEWVLKVMANLLEPEERGVGERAYAMVEAIVSRVPER